MAKVDRDAYDLEKTDDRRYVLALAVEGVLSIRRANEAMIHRIPTNVHDRSQDVLLEAKHQKAYLDMARAGLLIGNTITGKGHRAAVDWGVIK